MIYSWIVQFEANEIIHLFDFKGTTDEEWRQAVLLPLVFVLSSDHGIAEWSVAPTLLGQSAHKKSLAFLSMSVTLTVSQLNPPPFYFTPQVYWIHIKILSFETSSLDHLIYSVASNKHANRTGDLSNSYVNWLNKYWWAIKKKHVLTLNRKNLKLFFFLIKKKPIILGCFCFIIRQLCIKSASMMHALEWPLGECQMEERL